MKPVNSPVGAERASWYSKLCDRIWHGSISDTAGYLVGTDFLLSEMFLRISLVIFLFCFHHHCLCNFYFSMLTQDSSFFNYLLISSLSAMCLRLDSYTTFYLSTLMLVFLFLSLCLLTSETFGFCFSQCLPPLSLIFIVSCLHVCLDIPCKLLYIFSLATVFITEAF